MTTFMQFFGIFHTVNVLDLCELKVTLGLAPQ